MGGKITFSPWGFILCFAGILLGFFFCDSIIGFIQGITQTGTPTSNMITPLFADAGIGLVTGIALVILSLMFLKRFIGFIICVFIGVICCLILAGMGITIPNPISFIVGVI